MHTYLGFQASIVTAPHSTCAVQIPGLYLKRFRHTSTRCSMDFCMHKWNAKAISCEPRDAIGPPVGRVSKISFHEHLQIHEIHENKDLQSISAIRYPVGTTNKKEPLETM